MKMTAKAYFRAWGAFSKSKVDRNKNLVKNEAFESQDTKPYVTVYIRSL